MTIHNAPKHCPTGNPQNLRRWEGFRYLFPCGTADSRQRLSAAGNVHHRRQRQDFDSQSLCRRILPGDGNRPQITQQRSRPRLLPFKKGTNTLTFVNHYMLADMEILKTSPDGKVDGIAFTVTDSRGNVVGSGVTDQNGRLVVPGLTKGVAYTVEETVPEGYVCDNPGRPLSSVREPIPSPLRIDLSMGALR